ncbi:MAG TPA: hypothetical protein VGR73_12085 [Bryobacteraceae bacterium]|nr:hypothetical protein [Bryobacteraceae bacterium]
MRMPMLLLAAAVLAQAAPASLDVPRVIYTRSFPGSVPPYFAITIFQDGAAVYNESQDPDNGEKISLEASAARQAFELADRLDHFRHPLESGLKLANLGEKTLRWEQGEENSESKFNYSTSEDAKALVDLCERVEQSARMLLDLRRALKHDRLGVNDAVVRIQSAWDGKQLLLRDDFLPLLDQVAKNDVYIHMARERAARIADAIRAAH